MENAILGHNGALSSAIASDFSVYKTQKTTKKHDSKEGLVRLWRTKPWLYRGISRGADMLKRAALKNPKHVAEKKPCSCLLQQECQPIDLGFPSHLTRHPYTKEVRKHTTPQQKKHVLFFCITGQIFAMPFTILNHVSISRAGVVGISWLA